MHKAKNRAELFSKLMVTVAQLAKRMDSETTCMRVLDLGCGAGGLVYELRQMNLDAYGCDFVFKDGPQTEKLVSEGYIKEIRLTPYTIPFEDAYFDFVVSDQVLEHVQDLGETNRELYRVLRPTGACIHIFPSIYTPIEPHVKIPLATIIQNRTWLSVWHKLGIGRLAGHDTNASLVEANLTYLTQFTHYRSHRETDRLMRQYFETSGNLEHELLGFRFRNLPSVIRPAFVKLLSPIYRIFRDRVIYASKV